jgi:tetratricopeptide (TPR) repeat protein
MRCFALCFCLLLLCGRAAAQDDSSAARRHFETGTRAFNLGEFTTAAEEYRAAYKLKPDPAILYNIAQSYRLSKNTEQALFFYRSYLRNANDPAHREEVEDRIRALEEQQKQQQAPPNGVDKPAPDPSRAELVASAPPPKQPAYKKWWVWTLTGAVVVGVGVGVGLGLGLKPGAPGTPLGNYKVF